MEGTEQSLELELEKYAMPVKEAVDPIDPTAVVVVDPPVAEPVVTDAVVVEEDENTEGDEDGDAIFKTAFGVFGYDKEIKIETKEDIVATAKAVKEFLDSQNAIYNRQDVKDIVEYIKVNGSIVGYDARPQPTTEYQIDDYAEDAIADAEAFLVKTFTMQGLKPALIKASINELKESGELILEANERLEFLRSRELQNNTELEEGYRKEIESEQQAATEHFKGLATAFDNPLNGVTVDKALLDEAKTSSFVDGNGEVPIMKLASEFTPKQHAILNTAILAIAKEKNFEYKPIKTAPAKRGAVVDTLIKKGTSSGGVGSGFISPEEFTKELRNASN